MGGGKHIPRQAPRTFLTPLNNDFTADSNDKTDNDHNKVSFRRFSFRSLTVDSPKLGLVAILSDSVTLRIALADTHTTCALSITRIFYP